MQKVTQTQSRHQGCFRPLFVVVYGKEADRRSRNPYHRGAGWLAVLYTDIDI